MAEAPKKTKYLTLTFKYSENVNCPIANSSRFLSTLIQTVNSYNANRNNSDIACFDLVGMYIDPDDMDIEEQNSVFNDAAEQLSASKIKNKSKSVNGSK